MFRTHFHTPIIPLVFLGLALYTTAVLVVNVIRPEYIPVQYSETKEASLSPTLNRAQRADAARWQGWADYNSAALAQPARSQLADVARWEGLANYYILNKSALSRAQITAALRWTALAIHYGSAPDYISPQLQFLLDQRHP